MRRRDGLMLADPCTHPEVSKSVRLSSSHPIGSCMLLLETRRLGRLSSARVSKLSSSRPPLRPTPRTLARTWSSRPWAPTRLTPWCPLDVPARRQHEDLVPGGGVEWLSGAHPSRCFCYCATARLRTPGSAVISLRPRPSCWWRGCSAFDWEDMICFRKRPRPHCQPYVSPECQPGEQITCWDLNNGSTYSPY